MMSDVEEPPSKVTKIELETSQPHDESLETAEHGHEEWLSEEVLTDEDYNQTLEQDVSQEGNTSQDDSQFSMAENSLDTADQINKLEEHLDEYQEEDRLTEEDQTVMEEERLVEEDQTVMEEERLVEEDHTVMEEDRLTEEDQTIMEEERLIEEDQTVTEEHTVTDKDQSVTDKDQTEKHVDNVKQEVTEADVEEQLNSLENVERKDKEDKKPGEPLTADLGMFLVRKSDGQVDVMTERKDSSEFEPSEKHSDEEDDGNNTDELLRMLGEDNNKAKKAQLSKNGKKQLTVKKEDADSSDSDFEGALVTTTMKVAKRVLMNKKPARKAEPEDMSDSEQSEEENRAMADAISSRHYQVKKKLNVASKSTAKSSITSRNMSRTKPKTSQVSAQKTTSISVKNSVKSVTANGSSVKKTTKVPELSPKISERAKSLLQKMNSSIINNATKHPTPTPQRSSSRSHKAPVKLISAPSPPLRKGQGGRREGAKIKEEVDSDEMEDSKDFLSLMKPERMEEESPSEEESVPSDASFYDEMPSSDSEDVEDWFALDVRAERAGDYIPLLGHRAFELLGEEKKRVVKKLTDLRESITSLNERSRDQMKEIENARKALAELDALLIHT
ncbi:hypothetical protein JYU34_018197 [Plutella xylostella]|uniref:Uncharacterized protein n=1 Tax=Plutella xylostella TaxID=51655 RepID=A0ABQ7PZY8_PLUXY|nr:hypothetical protein JYU34_018197 [Plutella xylostella]